MVTAVFYITGHGFGHASRSLEVVNALLTARPDTRIVVRSSAPEWFLRASARQPIDVQLAETDTGVVQRDSLSLDEAETIRQAAAFYADAPDAFVPVNAWPSRVRREAAVLTALDATVVVGDIPPLAFAAARAAGVPSVAVGNFTWDWIYGGYAAFVRSAPGVIDTIRRAYAAASLALRLPFHGGFESMPVVRDIPLVARRSRFSPADARRALGLPDTRPLVLASFGGHGLRLSYEALAQRNDVTLLVTDHEAAGASSTEHLRVFSSDQLRSRGLRYEDLVVAADLVVSKPGYGIISECIANGTALLFTLRGPFIEQDVFLRDMPRFLRSRAIDRDDLLSGRWRGDIGRLLEQAPPPEHLATDGAAIAAAEIARLATPG